MNLIKKCNWILNDQFFFILFKMSSFTLNTSLLLVQELPCSLMMAQGPSSLSYFWQFLQSFKQTNFCKIPAVLQNFLFLKVKAVYRLTPSQRSSTPSLPALSVSCLLRNILIFCATSPYWHFSRVHVALLPWIFSFQPYWFSANGCCSPAWPHKQFPA